MILAANMNNDTQNTGFEYSLIEPPLPRFSDDASMMRQVFQWVLAC